MGAISGYILTVICIAIVSAIVTRICGNNQSVGNIIKLITAVAMTITIIAPFLSISVDGLSNYMHTIEMDANGIVSRAQEQAKNDLQAIITEKVETYIINKAATYDAEISVSVEIPASDSLIPDTITIEGEVSPYIKEILVKIIEDDLGIPEDRQIWK